MTDTPAKLREVLKSTYKQAHNDVYAHICDDDGDLKAMIETIKMISLSDIHGEALTEFVKTKLASAPHLYVRENPKLDESKFTPLIRAIDNTIYKHELFLHIVNASTSELLSAADVLYVTNALVCDPAFVKRVVKMRRVRYFNKYHTHLQVDDMLFCGKAQQTNRFIANSDLLIFIVTEADTDDIGIDWAKLRHFVATFDTQEGEEWGERAMEVVDLLERQCLGAPDGPSHASKKQKTDK